MLIVAGSIITTESGRAGFLEAAQTMVDATRQEAGCLEYVMAPDPGDPTRVVLFEQWEDQDCLDAHFASEHMATWRTVRADLDVVGSDIKTYEIAAVTSM